MRKVRVHIFVSGKVQGVFYRDTAKKEAKKLEIFGWIKNLSDGRVEAVFEGDEEKVESMISWAKKGPVLAQVKDVQIQREEYKKEFNDFKIVY